MSLTFDASRSYAAPNGSLTYDVPSPNPNPNPKP